MAGSVPSPNERDPIRIVQAIRELFAGRSNAVGTCVLDAGTTASTVTFINCGASSKIFLTPLSADAAAETPTLYVTGVASGQFTLAHSNSASTDRRYSFAVIG